MKVHNRIQFDTPGFHPGIIPATPGLRSSRGSHQLNDELRIKAEELEKLFAAHKLRVHGPDRMQRDHAPGKRPAIEDENYFVEDQCYVYEDDRGKGRLYRRYMQKRDEKLKEEWRSKRVHKEANMKAMQDSIEQTGAEMTAQFAVLSNSPESVLRSRRHAGSPSSSSVSAVESKEETSLEYIQTEEEDRKQELSQEVYYGRDKSHNMTVLSDSSTSVNSSKLLSKRNVSVSRSASSAMSQTSVAPTPRLSTVKATNTGVTRPRTQSDNFHERRTPGYANAGMKKENTNPLNGTCKVTYQASLENLPRSQKTDSAMKDSKEGKSRRTGNKTLGRLSKDPSERSISNKFQKSSGSKPFLRKGNGIGPREGAGSAKRKAPLPTELIKNGEEFEDEDIERTPASGTTLSFPSGSDSDDPMSAQESTMSGGRRTVYNDVMIHHSFSYAQEPSNAVASMDPSRGSSASCNSRPVKKIQSPKDVSKGFMRLLSFGKKGKAVENTVSDIESASARFEGAYDSEDRNEMATRSTKNPKISRMGYSIADYGACSMVDILPGRVPSCPILGDDHRSNTPKSQRSLFSLPPFRSRRGGSKLK